jgi:polyisoprenoid-binding protein YceI
MHEFDESTAECLVFTYKEGLLSAVAHDLKIRVGRFRVVVDESQRTVEGRFDADSLRVVCAMSGGVEAKGTLSAEQKREIEANIVRYVLEAEKYPEVRYVSSAVEDERGGFRVRGQLQLHGVRRAVEVTVRRSRRRYVAGARIHQPDFGIRPYSALLGTLKVRADVEVQLILPEPAGA